MNTALLESVQAAQRALAPQFKALRAATGALNQAVKLASEERMDALAMQKSLAKLEAAAEQVTDPAFTQAAADFAAATGFHGGTHAVRALLAGAQAVQTVSALHREGLGQIDVILDELRTWMSRKGHSSLADFRGQVSQARTPEAPLFTRLQYMKRLAGA